MQLRTFDPAHASLESEEQPASQTALRVDPRLGPLGATWRDWLLIVQVTAVALVGLWLVAGGYITFGGVSPG